MARRDVPSSFNELHSAFVTTQNGTSLAELLQVLGCISVTPILVPLLIPWLVPPSFVHQAVANREFFFLIRAILEYPLIIVFPVWIVTVFAGGDNADSGLAVHASSVLLVTLLAVMAGILIANHTVTAPKWLGFWQHWNKLKDMPTGWSKKKTKEAASQSQDKIPFITNYRAIVIYITALCILAIDFVVFPRRFAKTKDYGISLMDVGTGCFIFANGIVSPEARNKRSPLIQSMKSAVPIVLLGFVRLVTVKGIEYQEVVEEYGVHWNFFFTLAGIKILSSFLFTYFDASHGLKLAALLSFLYEAFLHFGDYQNAFILNPNVPRDTSLLHANREGIFSVFGYLSIYMASVYFGKFIYWKDRTSVKDWGKYAIQSFLQVTILWTCYGAASYCGIFPCRRTANLGYILLMTALNYSLLWGQMFLALTLVCLQHHGILYGPIVFYELAALEQRSTSRMQRLQKMSKEFSQVKAKAREDCLDEQLKNLEDELRNACEEIKKLKRNKDNSNNSQLALRIESIEKEIEDLERKLMESSSDVEYEGEEDKTEQKNLVLLPDLSKSPVLLEAICFNGLAVFLVANVLTGIINCSVYTMYTSAYIALCYLWFYVTMIAGFSVLMYWFEIQLKFW